MSGQEDREALRRVLAVHRPGAISAGYIACACDPSTWGSPGEFAAHQAEQVAALWGAR